MLGKLPVPGHPTNLAHSRVRPSVLAVGDGWNVWTFFSHLSFLSPFSLCLSLGGGPI